MKKTNSGGAGFAKKMKEQLFRYIPEQWQGTAGLKAQWQEQRRGEGWLQEPWQVSQEAASLRKIRYEGMNLQRQCCRDVDKRLKTSQKRTSEGCGSVRNRRNKSMNCNEERQKKKVKKRR